MENRKTLAAALLCLCLCLFLLACAQASGIETDEDGGVWDYGRGIYTDASGNSYQIDNSDNGGGSSASESVNVKNDDGSMTVVTNEKDSVKQNADGSIEVESGQIQGPQEPETTRAPLEGDEWQAALAGVAARNGSETPTVWTNPATGEVCAAEVVYMGIGRSMVKVNGEKKMVNTVDLKWETEAPEDKVLATVRTKYVWMRKKPSNDKTNLKFKQIYRDSVMRVIGTGKNWTFVDYDGYRGYVSTGALEFYYNDHTEFDAGYVSVKGRLKGRESIQLRAREGKGILEIQTCPGADITVFDIMDDFAEVDVNGKHCLINSKYLTLAKDIASRD
jgi:hypothetical protein